MRFFELKQIANYLNRYKNISSIFRIADNTLCLQTKSEGSYYFHMQRSNSYIYKTSRPERTKIYKAPFDSMLERRFNRAQIRGVKILDNDKLIQIEAIISGGYKEQKSILQLEFTGRHTNVIILDEQLTVLEALRHIDINTSSRPVRVGQTLLPLHPNQKVPIDGHKIEDVESFLYAQFNEKTTAELESIRKQKSSMLFKRLKKLQKRFDTLEDENFWQEKALALKNEAEIVIANLHLIKPYEKSVILNDFHGDSIEINLNPDLPTAAMVSKYIFKQAKKARQRSHHIHLERQSLEEKIAFLRHFADTIERATSKEELNFLMPTSVRRKGSTTQLPYEVFYIEGLKVMLGRSQKSNEEVLRAARAQDIWFHLQNISSAHVVVVSNKQQLPISVIERAARLCVDFSVTQSGTYAVDYVKRREVRPETGSRVLYNNYKTINIDVTK